MGSSTGLVYLSWYLVPGHGTMAAVNRCDEMEPHFGGPDFLRIWCTAEDCGLNPYRRIEFCGWPIAWGDGPLDVPVSVFPYQGASYVANRVELNLYRTTEGRIVSALELISDAPREFASSPPDLWTTFLDEHDDLDAAAAWAYAVRGLTNPSAEWPVLHEVIDQARETLGAITPG